MPRNRTGEMRAPSPQFVIQFTLRKADGSFEQPPNLLSSEVSFRGILRVLHAYCQEHKIGSNSLLPWICVTYRGVTVAHNTRSIHDIETLLEPSDHPERGEWWIKRGVF